MDKETQDFIANLLRQGTIKWDGRAECLRRARKKVFVRVGLKGQKIYKYFWQCALCRVWFRDVGQLEVDHIVEIGPHNGDLCSFMKRVYCGQDNLRALCIVCHLKKTSGYNAARKYQRKK